ncbi:MAG: hypothetical protein IJ730_03535, partial [Alphaproteobacteria bacterium]|nr:hypothetical protein [Alphaproteobacteria bacterium]
MKNKYLLWSLVINTAMSTLSVQAQFSGNAFGSSNMPTGQSVNNNMTTSSFMQSGGMAPFTQTQSFPNTWGQNNNQPLPFTPSFSTSSNPFPSIGTPGFVSGPTTAPSLSTTQSLYNSTYNAAPGMGGMGYASSNNSSLNTSTYNAVPGMGGMGYASSNNSSLNTSMYMSQYGEKEVRLTYKENQELLSKNYNQ